MNTKDFLKKVLNIREKVEKENPHSHIDDEYCLKMLEYVLSERYNQDYWINERIKDLVYKLSSIDIYEKWDTVIIPIIDDLKTLCKARNAYRK